MTDNLVDAHIREAEAMGTQMLDPAWGRTDNTICSKTSLGRLTSFMLSDGTIKHVWSNDHGGVWNPHPITAGQLAAAVAVLDYQATYGNLPLDSWAEMRCWLDEVYLPSSHLYTLIRDQMLELRDCDVEDFPLPAYSEDHVWLWADKHVIAPVVAVHDMDKGTLTICAEDGEQIRSLGVVNGSLDEIEKVVRSFGYLPADASCGWHTYLGFNEWDCDAEVLGPLKYEVRTSTVLVP